MRLLGFLFLISASIVEGFSFFNGRSLLAAKGKNHTAKGKASLTKATGVKAPIPVTAHDNDDDSSCPDLLDTLSCPVTDYSEQYWAQNFPSRIAITGTWVGRGVFYGVNESTLVLTPLAWSDAVLKQFYDPVCGCSVTQFWTRPVALVEGQPSPFGEGVGVGIPDGNFSTYGPVHECETCKLETCLIADHTVTFEQYFTEVKIYGQSGFETNTHFNKSTGRVEVHEAFRYPSYPLPQKKMVTTFQQYDDSTNSLVLWNAYNLCFYSISLSFNPAATSQWPLLCGVINPSPPTPSPTPAPV